MWLESMLIKIALIGVLGVGAQWIAWRTRKPAIAFMLAAGLLAGPVLHLIDPKQDFGALQQPMIKLAVAVILFEGGLTLNLRDLHHAGTSVKRLVFLGVPIGWALCTLAVRFGTGLGWDLSALLGGILVVTGPTVIGPMLRSLNLPRRTSDALKWESIVNDPIGALIGIGVAAWIAYQGPDVSAAGITLRIVAASLAAAAIGGAVGYGLTWLFPRGYVPEYLKAPVLLVCVIAAFVLADQIQHEAGLITVTVMGVVMANRPTFSTAALRRFKEDLAVLLVSGVFIILSATLNWEIISLFRLRFVLFLVLLMFVARPLTVLLSHIGSGVPLREQLFMAWIAPRGVVAVAITGLLALRLEEHGTPGATVLVPLAFSAAVATILLHGFTAAPFARLLGIDKGKGKRLLLVGSNRWTRGLARAMADAGAAVEITDNSHAALRLASEQGLQVFPSDMLDDDKRHLVDWPAFQRVVAASGNDAYNALVCAEVGPELGYDKIIQVPPDTREGMTSARGDMLGDPQVPMARMLAALATAGHFVVEDATEAAMQADPDRGIVPLALVRPDGGFRLFTMLATPERSEGDRLISFHCMEDAQ